MRTAKAKCMRLWCLAVDWTEPIGDLYRHDGSRLRKIIGGGAQHAWFLAHNNRIYRWLDTEKRP